MPVPDPLHLIDKATYSFVQEWMALGDPSHDFQHVLRVYNQAMTLMDAEDQANPKHRYDARLIAYAAFLHDIGDRKYFPHKRPIDIADPEFKYYTLLLKHDLQDTEAANVVFHALRKQNFDADWAEGVQMVCNCVSYSFEKSNPDTVRGTLKTYPELAIVQDADRLDAIGAVGIARVFAYTGAKYKVRGFDGTLQHFDDKLLNVVDRMKTKVGRKMAWERTEKLKTFLRWWKEETELP